MKKLIPQSVVEALEHYVYRLEDPRTGKTFYIGKGADQRVLEHEWEALQAEIPSAKFAKIQEIIALGQQVNVIIHRHKMDEKTAYHVEAALIDAYENLTNMVRGHHAEYGAMPLNELILRYAAEQLNFQAPCIIFKIEKEWSDKLTPAALYERTRRYWKCSPHIRKPPPRYALAVARGLVREVYRVDRWIDYRGWPEDRDYSRNSDLDEKWEPDQLYRGFVGTVAHELAELKLKSTVHLTKSRSQNPFTYLNC
jgi:hypothetical protein